MSNIPSANQKIQIEPTQYRSPTSESLFQTIGGSVNYALDGVASSAALIAELNSSAKCLKQEGFQTIAETTIGNNGFYANGAIIDTNTETLTGSSTGLLLIYFAADRIDTTRDTSVIQIKVLNDPYYGSQVILNNGPLIGFNQTFFLVQTSSSPYQIQLNLISGRAAAGTGQANRWRYIFKALRFNPNSFITP
jgi:hypothetical protein